MLLRNYIEVSLGLGHEFVLISLNYLLLQVRLVSIIAEILLKSAQRHLLLQVQLTLLLLPSLLLKTLSLVLQHRLNIYFQLALIHVLSVIVHPVLVLLREVLLSI